MLTKTLYEPSLLTIKDVTTNKTISQITQREREERERGVKQLILTLFSPETSFTTGADNFLQGYKNGCKQTRVFRSCGG